MSEKQYEKSELRSNQKKIFGNFAKGKGVFIFNALNC